MEQQQRKAHRLELHDILLDVIGNGHCYFEAPSHMEFPCIKYDNSGEDVRHSDNMRFIMRDLWTITVIDPDPDSEIPAKLYERFQNLIRKDREFATDGLHHFVYRLYF